MHAAETPTLITSVFWLLLSVVTLLYYLAARHHRSPRFLQRLPLFAAGSMLMMLAFSPPMMAWAHHDIRGHMVQHVLLGMFAPLAWVLASPMTLALRSLPARYARWSSNLLRHPFFFYLTHPITATLLNIGGMYLLYATPLYQASLNNLALHLMIHVHFILAGYLYCWSIAGCEPSFHPFSFKMRLTVLLFGIAAHSYLAKLMYINLWPSLPFNSADDLQTAAKIMYYGGDLAEALLAIVLFSGWLENNRKRLMRFSKRYHIEDAFRI